MVSFCWKPEKQPTLRDAEGGLIYDYLSDSDNLKVTSLLDLVSILRGVDLSLLSFVKILVFALLFANCEANSIFYLFYFYLTGGSCLALLIISLKTFSSFFWFRHSYIISFLILEGALLVSK